MVVADVSAGGPSPRPRAETMAVHSGVHSGVGAAVTSCCFPSVCPDDAPWIETGAGGRTECHRETELRSAGCTCPPRADQALRRPRLGGLASSSAAIAPGGEDNTAEEENPAPSCGQAPALHVACHR
jgi:hypothetical protein